MYFIVIKDLMKFYILLIMELFLYLLYIYYIYITHTIFNAQ
jgi:hypothetical protein